MTPSDEHKKWSLILVGTTVLVLVVGGVVWSLQQPDRIEKYWVVAGPIVLASWQTMRVLNGRRGN